jgi:hypothetical protein
MKTIDHPALRRGPSGHPSARPLPALAACLVAVALVASFGAVPARAGWTVEQPVSQVWNTRPAVAMDGGGHLGVAWQESSDDAGILFATNAGGTWTTSRISTGDDWSPDVVFDLAGDAQVLFARSSGAPGIYLATNAGGTWSVSQLRADVAPGSPSVALDAAGKLHVAYESAGFTPGIWYLTNAGGAWASTRVTSGTWDSEPSLALDPAGKAHIAFARYDVPSPGLFIATNAAGTWATTRLTTNDALDDYPALVIDAAGHRHVAALRYADTPTQLLYLTDETGSWVTSNVPLDAGLIGLGAPAIGLDGSGEPEIVVRLGMTTAVDDTLWRFTNLPSGSSQRLLVGGERNDEWPDILRDATGRLAVVYRAAWHEPGIMLHRTGPDEDTLIAPSVIVERPALATDGIDKRYLAFERFATDASDGTSYAEKVSGAWSDETIAATHGKPDIGIGYLGVRRVVIPDRMFTSTDPGWDTHLFGMSGGTDVALDDDLFTQWKVAYFVPGSGIRVMHEDLGEEQATTGGSDEGVDISAGGAGGSEHYFIAFVRDGQLHLAQRYWDPALQDQVIDSGPAWNPATMRPVVNSTYSRFVGYDRGGSGAGIYLADEATLSGAQQPRRVSRAYADVTPAVAARRLSGPDAPTELYVVWARDCGGPSPGVFMATNRTGSWVTTQVVQACGAYDPAVEVLADGRLVIAYQQDPGGIVVLTETTAGGAAVVRVGVDAESRSSAATPEGGFAGLGRSGLSTTRWVSDERASGRSIGPVRAGTGTVATRGGSSVTARTIAERFARSGE